MRVLKWISLVIAGLVVLLLVAVLVLVWVVDPNGFKPQIESAVKDATGREFSLVGDIELGVFPWLSLRTGEGQFGNAPDFGPEPMVRWKSAEVGAKLIPLLRGELVARRVRLEGADVRLVRRADGHANWEGIGGDAPKDPNAQPMKLHIDGVELKDSRLSFVDETAPRTIVVEKLELTTDEIAEGTPLTDTELRGVLHTDGFTPAGVTFELEIPKADVAWDLSKISIPEFALSVDAFEAKGGVDGGLGEPMRLAGSIATNEFDPRALLAAVGIDAPKTTDPQALSRVKAATQWSFDAGAIALETLTLDLDETHFTGNFRRSAGDAAVGEFALKGDRLDIARYLPPPDPASEPFVLPTAMLKDLKFRGTIELERATLDDVEMNGVTLRLVLDEKGLRSEAKK